MEIEFFNDIGNPLKYAISSICARRTLGNFNMCLVKHMVIVKSHNKDVKILVVSRKKIVLYVVVSDTLPCVKLLHGYHV